MEISLPEQLARRVRRLAELVGLDANAVLVDRLSFVLPPVLDEIDLRPVETLSDNELTILADGAGDMTHDQLARLHTLEKADILTGIEKTELQMLTEFYDTEQTRRKAALVEAMRRGLREER
jgi:hypothetical protein